MEYHDLLLYALLIFAGWITGFINTVAGGGSLLTLPLLMFMGLSHTEANGTNRVSVLMQSVGAVAGFKSKKVSSFPIGLWQGLIAAVGAVLGALLAIYIDAESFKTALAVIIVGVVLLILLNPKPDALRINNATVKFTLSMGAFFLIGIYGGFIQAGLGFLSILASTVIDRFDIHRANHAKVFVTLCITIVAMAIFIYQDLINWVLGFVLAFGSIGGSWTASRWSVNKSERLIKGFLLIMACVVAIKLVFFD